MSMLVRRWRHCYPDAVQSPSYRARSWNPRWIAPGISTKLIGQSLDKSSQAEPQHPIHVPFRQRWKDRKGTGSNPAPPLRPAECAGVPKWDNHKWELTVGLEIHAQLNTERKLFSEAATSVVDAPNSHVSVFDAALPGSQPSFQSEAIIPALRAALALDCQVQNVSRFDRKHYFYRDQPAGYQITQYHEPLGRDGRVILYNYDGIAPEEGSQISIGIKQVHIEQDTAKTLTQPPTTHLLDFNRVSHPLLEIVTMPQIHHPSSAAALVKKIQGILKSVNACTLGMEMGGLRTDVNISVRRRVSAEKHGAGGSSPVQNLGQRTEIKNLCSYKAIEDAIEAERNRQVAILETGGSVAGETRGWTLGGEETRKLRGKEGEVDYRYLPEPDLAPVIISDDLINHIKASLPLSPDAQIRDLMQSPENGLSLTDAKIMVSLDDGKRLDYYQSVCQLVRKGLEGAESSSALDGKTRIGRTAANWVLNELGSLLTSTDKTWDENPVQEEQLAEILVFLIKGQITGKSAKHLLSLIFHSDPHSTPKPITISQLIAEHNLLFHPLSDAEYDALARAVFAQHPALVEQLRQKPKPSKISFLVGQMMRSGDAERIEAARAEEVVKWLLSSNEMS